MGISIALISCLFYVVTWEIIYFNFMHDFMDKYSANAVGKLQASGASAAAVQAKIEEMQKLKESYENPLFNAAMTRSLSLSRSGSPSRWFPRRSCGESHNRNRLNRPFRPPTCSGLFVPASSLAFISKLRIRRFWRFCPPFF
jgi:hypothetical protein